MKGEENVLYKYIIAQYNQENGGFSLTVGIKLSCQLEDGLSNGLYIILIK